MKKAAAEKYRDVSFSRARRGAVVKPEPGKTKISIRLDNAVLEHVHRRSTLDVLRQVAREELAPFGARQARTRRSSRRPTPSS